MLFVNIQYKHVWVNGYYPEGAFGNWQKLVPSLPFWIIILVANEGLIFCFDVGREAASQECIKFALVGGLGLFHRLPGDRCQSGYPVLSLQAVLAN